MNNSLKINWKYQKKKTFSKNEEKNSFSEKKPELKSLRRKEKETHTQHFAWNKSVERKKKQSTTTYGSAIIQTRRKNTSFRLEKSFIKQIKERSKRKHYRHTYTHTCRDLLLRYINIIEFWWNLSIVIATISLHFPLSTNVFLAISRQLFTTQ